GDIFFRDGRIVDAPSSGAADETYNVSNKIVMAGAIDVHSHIAGNNETMGRLLLPEQRYPSDVVHAGHFPQPRGTWNTFSNGRIHAMPGIPPVVNPAVPRHQAMPAHL